MSYTWRPFTSVITSVYRYNLRRMADTASLKQRVPTTEVKFEVPWGHIKGCQWGKPTGTPVLAIHGWLDNAGSFSTLAPFLSDDLNVVAIDLPGHGQSSHRPLGSRCNFIDYLTDVKRVIDCLGWKEFLLLGHSLGASISAWFAGALPDMVKGLVCIEGFGVLTRSINDIPELMGKALLDMGDPVDKRVYSTWEAAVERLKEGHVTDPDITIEAAEVLCKRGTIKVDGGYKFSRDLRLKQRSILYATDELNKSILSRISCPILLIFAEKTFIQPETINTRLEVLKKPNQISIVRVPGGHHLHMYNPESIGSLVDSFLHSLSVPPEYNVIARL